MSPVSQLAAVKVLEWLHAAEDDLIGATVVTFNGETGVVHAVKLDEHHGLCFSIDQDPHKVFREGLPPVRWYPVSTIRMKS